MTEFSFTICTSSDAYVYGKLRLSESRASLLALPSVSSLWKTAIKREQGKPTCFAKREKFEGSKRLNLAVFFMVQWIRIIFQQTKLRNFG